MVICALSDKADGNAHESYENFGDIAADNSSKIVLKMLDAIGKQNRFSVRQIPRPIRIIQICMEKI